MYFLRVRTPVNYVSDPGPEVVLWSLVLPRCPNTDDSVYRLGSARFFYL